VPGTPASADLCLFVIYRCIVGSTAYGLSQEGSDADRRGVYLPPAHLEWSLAARQEFDWSGWIIWKLEYGANLNCLHRAMTIGADMSAAWKHVPLTVCFDYPA
jgi:hypothetical protein